MEKEIQLENHVIVFNDNKIRRTLHNNEWWFVILDVIAALTNSPNPASYAKMLGEASTTEIARNNNAQGFDDNREAARSGGKVAGSARKDLESKSGKKVVTRKNYLAQQKALIEEFDDK